MLPAMMSKWASPVDECGTGPRGDRRYQAVVHAANRASGRAGGAVDRGSVVVVDSDVDTEQDQLGGQRLQLSQSP